MEKYDYVIVGAGICGCSIAYELSKTSKKILLIDKLSGVAKGASGAAGAFLSPLLGKPNEFKDLVTRSLIYSTNLYKKHFSHVIDNCGTTRIPKDETDAKKFESYKPFMDFPYEEDGDGYLFKIGTVVNSLGICKTMTTPNLNDIDHSLETKFNYEIKSIVQEGDNWILNDEISTQKLILATGHETDLLDENYIQIRGVWGKRINIETSTKLDHNYHKACSVSKSFPISKDKFKVSIGATHHRKYEDVLNVEENNSELLKKAADIVELNDIKITREYIGARASSNDYFPMIGEIIDSKKTLEEFPYLVNGTHVQQERFSRYKNLYIFNGVGGRGFVLSPYLAKILASNIINNEPVDDNLTVDRLFKREVKRMKK